MMVEVFKTNVKGRSRAKLLIDQIHKNCVDHEANFDLDDCDKILRIECAGPIQYSQVIDILKKFGFDAEVLPGDEQTVDQAIFN